MERDHAALVAFINERQSIPHAWGREANDCVAYVLKAAEAQTGEKRGKGIHWASPKAALTVIKKFGSLEKALDAHFQRIPPSLAHRGDIGGVPDADFGIHPMIVEGELLVGPGDKGNRRLTRSAMTMAWSVGLPKPKKPK